MDTFNDEFQEYITWKMGAACSEIEDTEKWNELKNKYDTLYDLIYNSLNKEQKGNFDKFLNTVWKKANVELCVVYKVGITDKEDLKKYEILNNRKKEGAK